MNLLLCGFKFGIGAVLGSIVAVLVLAGIALLAYEAYNFYIDVKYLRKHGKNLT